MKEIWTILLVVLLAMGVFAERGWGGGGSTSVGFGRNSFGRGMRSYGYHHIRAHEQRP